MASSTEPTILILGAGVFGVSTAYHLSLAYTDPSRITVIDRTPYPPDPAASTDINKIIRADYSSAFYSELAYEAMAAWSEWPEVKDYYHRTGWIMLDTEDSDLSDRIRKVFRDRGHDPTTDIPLEALDAHWKGIMKGTETKGFKSAYWNLEAGWCNAAAATASMMASAVRRGVEYVVGDVGCILLNDDNSGVEGIITTDGRSITADKIVMATGAWTSSLLSSLETLLQIPEKDRIERQLTAAAVCVVHYKMSDEQMEQLSEMPVVVYGEHGEVIPAPPENKLLKYTNACTFTNTIITPTGQTISAPPAGRSQFKVLSALKKETIEIMSSKVLPTFTTSTEPAYWRLCWDARTPTQDFLLTPHPHPALQNLYLCTGGSFHGYKFLPIIGKYMLNVLSGISNGPEKDKAWGWKDPDAARGRGAHENTEPKRELRDLEERRARL